MLKLSIAAPAVKPHEGRSPRRSRQPASALATAVRASRRGRENDPFNRIGSIQRPPARVLFLIIAARKKTTKRELTLLRLASRLKLHRLGGSGKLIRRRLDELDKIGCGGLIFKLIIIINQVRMLSTSTAVPYFLYSSGILFREGLEALLVILALVAGVHEAGQDRRARIVYGGGLLAIGVSLALAWAVNHILGDNTSDTLEGLFQLTAAATLFYVSSWLTARGQAERWKDFIKAQVENASGNAGASIALGVTAFLAVMREGAETIVFFQALVSGATERIERHAIFLGVIAGAIALAIVFIMARKMIQRIPIGAFFSATSVMLYALAVIFAGQGIASFQESGVLAANFVNHVPTIAMLGLYPTVETLAAQLLLLLLAAAALVAPRIRQPRAIAAAQTPQPRSA